MLAIPYYPTGSKDYKRIKNKVWRNTINPEREKLRSKLYRLKKPEVRKNYYQSRRSWYLQYQRDWFQKNKESLKEKRKESFKDFKTKHPDYFKEWNRNNPKTPRNNLSLDAMIVMNQVRKKQHNTCQWYGCNRTNKDMAIHVHHIFPRSEYPQYESEEWNLICYCKEHHIKWHESRGDSGANFLKSMKDWRDKPFISLVIN